LHNSNFSNGSHFGRILRRPSAENTQDETPAFATMIFLAVIFHGRHFQKIWRHNLFSADILAEQAAVIVSK
jgi:hypothetical protein